MHNSHKPRLLIDATMLLSERTGIARYMYENALRLQPQLDTTYYYGYFSKSLLAQTTDRKRSSALVPTLRRLIQHAPLIKRSARALLSLAAGYRQEQFDLFWQPNFFSTASVRTNKQINTIHDFSFHFHPEWHPKERVNYFQKHFRKTIDKSDHLITGSKEIQDEIMAITHRPKTDISVIYHGVDNKLFHPVDKNILEQFKTYYQLPNQFILCVGSIEPRKNLLNLIRAYALLEPALRRELPLVLVGFFGWENQEIMKTIKPFASSVRYLGYLGNDELACAYSAATLFCYPSFYEGFGLPPLEAMACGTPVITSNISSMPEVCGDAALYCDPFRAEDITSKMLLLLNDASLRETMRQKGLLRAAEFSWDVSAKQHLELFTKLLGS